MHQPSFDKRTTFLRGFLTLGFLKQSRRQWAVVASLLLILAVCASAQVNSGGSAVIGTVRDASGAVVPEASVTLTNASKGINLTTLTTAGGVFAFPALQPATGFTLQVTKAGFGKWQAANFELNVGQTMDFKIDLAVSASAESVQVTAEAPLVEDTKSGVTATVGQLQIDNLPINGRRVDSYVLMTPAVTNDGEFGLISFRGVAMGNSFLTDGTDTTESFYNENAGRTRIGSQLSQDAVQEFQVLSDGFSAEFGRAMGGVVNTVTRSGSNELHGTAYGFYRNGAWSALDRYSNGIRTPEHRDTMGFSLGGPLKKDKIFYFVNYDYTGRNFPGINRIINNSLTDAAGNTIPASTCTATAAQCTAAINFIQGQMNKVVARTYDQDLGFAKIDWRPTERNTFSVDMNVMHWVSPHGIQTQTVLTNGNLVGNNGNSTVEDRYGKASWIYIPTASSVNELRFGWFKDRLSDPASSDLWPAATGGTYITVAGSTVGAAQAYPRTYPSENRYQLLDNYSLTKSSHSVKFGVDFSTTEDWMNQLFNQNGGYSYSNITAFAKDFNGGTFNSGVRNYTNYSQTFGNPIQDIRTTDVGLYVQDTWKITRRFTANLGLRWEKTLIPQPTITNPDWPQTGRIPSPNNEFSPRASFSYSLNDKTVIRAGYGIFYARFHGNMLDTLFLGNGQYQSSISLGPTQTGAPVFPLTVPSATGFPSGAIKLEFAAPDFHAPYTQQGTFAIERQLSRDMGFTASYIWSRGIGLYTQRDLNLGAPAAIETFTVQNASGATVNTFTSPVYSLANRFDPRYSSILQVENGGQSWYNALALQFQKRFSHNFQAQIAYTWSHAIDDGNEQGASWNISNTFNNATVPGNWGFDKGSSTLDQRHRASINWMWEPKFMSNDRAFGRYVVNGWQLSAITTLASAHPVTASDNSVSTGAGAIFPGITLAGNTFNGSGGWNRVPFLPVGGLNVDQIFGVDARLAKTFPIRERFKLAFGFEAFNLGNNIHNTAVQTSAYSLSSGGIFKPVLTNGVSLLGVGTTSQGFPDGTNARRLQALVRFTF
ncbi:MAG TPA: TonB-dependent receptor [Bryobacteraceae bacterium]|nr:TonB-dependent receptor [Bryobacteraceae bacterium]